MKKRASPAPQESTSPMARTVATHALPARPAGIPQVPVHMNANLVAQVSMPNPIQQARALLVPLDFIKMLKKRRNTTARRVARALMRRLDKRPSVPRVVPDSTRATMLRQKTSASPAARASTPLLHQQARALLVPLGNIKMLKKRRNTAAKVALQGVFCSKANA